MKYNKIRDVASAPSEQLQVHPELLPGVVAQVNYSGAVRGESTPKEGELLQGQMGKLQPKMSIVAHHIRKTSKCNVHDGQHAEQRHDARAQSLGTGFITRTIGIVHL